ncbi:MAG: efflux RND transporter periplasmic adaptor subunit [Rhodocyclaceae bacterium]
MQKSFLVLAGLALGGHALAAPPASAPVEYGEIELAYTADAVVEAVRQATVGAQVYGRVIEVRRDAGERVARGEVLARIDEREAAQAVAAADAQVARARAELANAQAIHERTRSLVARQFMSQAALDQAQAARLAAQAQLDQALAARTRAESARSFATVVSPLTGVVARRHVETGEMAVPGKPLLTVFEPGGLRVLAHVPQHRLAEVSRAREARIEFPDGRPAIASRDLTVLPTADPQTHSASARVGLPAGSAGIVPGMFARVHFVTGTARGLLVPAAAIVRRGELTGAYVVDAQGAVRLRQVRIGDRERSGRVEVLSGLAAGERVALDPVQAGMAARGATK